MAWNSDHRLPFPVFATPGATPKFCCYIKALVLYYAVTDTRRGACAFGTTTIYADSN